MSTITLQEFIDRVDSVMMHLEEATKELKAARELAIHNADIISNDKNPHHPWCSHFKTLGWSCEDATKILRERIRNWEKMKNNTK